MGRKFGQGVYILNDAWVINLKQSEEKIAMFCRSEAEFILDCSVQDLKKLEGKIDSVTSEIARLGKMLSEMMDAKQKLMGISEKLARSLQGDDEEDEAA